MIKCEGCGASMIFDPEKQMLVCAFCGSAQYVENLKADQYYSKAGEKPFDETTDQEKCYDAMVYMCPDCGGELVSYDETAATFCSFCGESVLLEKRLMRMEAPTYIIPFSQTKEDCRREYKKKLRGAIFAPNALRREADIARFRGIYMPYWTYTSNIHTKISATGMKEYRNGNYVTRTSIRVDKDIHGMYEGRSYDAASDFDDELSGASGPFDVREARPFSPAYLSGFYADAGDVSASIYEGNSLDEARDYFTDEIQKDPMFNRNNVTRADLKKSVYPIAHKAVMGLFPVWFLAIRTRDQKRVSYAVVNGQTGKVAADLPVDYFKYVLGSLLLAVPIFFLLNLVLTLSPVKMLLVAMFLCLFSMYLLNMQVNRTFTKENNLDDAGVLAAQGMPESMKGVELKRANLELRRFLISLGWFVIKAMAVIAVIYLGILAIALVSFVWDSGLVYLMGIAGIVFGSIAVVKWIKKRRLQLGENKQEVIYQAPKKVRMKTLMKPISGLILALVIYTLNPAQDVTYYTAAAVMLALIAWSVFDIIEQHNLQTTRKLPQFGKRGGDHA